LTTSRRTVPDMYNSTTGSTPEYRSHTMPTKWMVYHLHSFSLAFLPPQRRLHSFYDELEFSNDIKILSLLNGTLHFVPTHRTLLNCLARICQYAHIYTSHYSAGHCPTYQIHNLSSLESTIQQRTPTAVLAYVSRARKAGILVFSSQTSGICLLQSVAPGLRTGCSAQMQKSMA
jgi:hypothetical protein